MHRNYPVVGLYSRRSPFRVAANSLRGEIFSSLRKRRRRRNTVAPVVRKTNIISASLVSARTRDYRWKTALCNPCVSLIHLSLCICIYIFVGPPSERNTKVHFTRPPCIFAKFAIKTEVRGSRFASMTQSLARFPETSTHKKYSPSFRATQVVREGTTNRFSAPGNKIFASISYGADSRAAFFYRIVASVFLVSFT